MKPNNQHKEKCTQNDRRRYMRHTLYMISGIMLLVLVSAGMISTAFAADSPDAPASASAHKPAAIEEFSGEVVQLAGTQTADIVWDKDNFGGFCYDLNGIVGTETLTIAAGTLTGPNVDRTIEEDRLVYTTIPLSRTYAIIDDGVADSLGRVYGIDVTSFAVEGWMGKKRVAISTGGSTALNANKLSKLLVEFKANSDKKTLATGDPWDLGGGFTLTAKQIDLQGNKVWLSLGKDDKEIDDSVIDAGPYGDKRYMHTEDLYEVDDVVVFFCWVDTVFRGTESNLVQVRYVFLIDNDIEKIETSTTYGNMEVETAIADRVVLKNDGSIDLIRNTEVEIMGDLSFKTANNAGAIEFYPHLIRDELPVLTEGDEFAAWDSGESIWNSTYKPTATEELSGESAELAGTQTTNLVWNKNNFEGFWYDIDGGAGTETLLIASGTLTSPNTDRTIEPGALSYTTSPFWQEYELHKNLGLTVERNIHTSDSGYSTEFWMGERYVAINGRPDKLIKPLIEFNNADIKILATEEAWDLGGGLALVARQIDLRGEKVWLCLNKDGTWLDSAIIDTGSSDLQSRVYTYTVDLAGESDVPVFFCYVSGVFRGVESNMVQVKYVFLIDNVVYQIRAGDTYDNMEVVSTTSSQVTLENRNNIALSQSPSTHQIMGNLSFKTVDSSGAIEFYPHLIRNELMALSGGGDEFGSEGCGEYSWNLHENYTIGWYPAGGRYQVDLRGEKAWIALCKDGVTVDIRMLIEEFKTHVDSECRYSYTENGIEVISATLEAVFRGHLTDVVKLKNVNQYSSTGTQLMYDESKTYANADPTGEVWRCWEGYSLDPKDISIAEDEVWLSLSKNGVIVKDAIVDCNVDRWFRYYNTTGALVFSTYVGAVFSDADTNLVLLESTTQYSEADGDLLVNQRKESWQLYENYDLTAIEAYDNGSAWLKLSQNGRFMDEGVFHDGFSLRNKTTGYTIVSGTISGFTYNITPYSSEAVGVTLASITQYRETDGEILSTWGSKTLNETKNRIILRTGIAIIKHTGDLNGDNRITPADAAIALRLTSTGAHNPAADVSGDGCVTSLDALMILQAAAGNIEL